MLITDKLSGEVMIRKVYYIKSEEGFTSPPTRDVIPALVINSDKYFLSTYRSECMIKFDGQPSNIFVCFTSKSYLHYLKDRLRGLDTDMLLLDYLRYPNARWCFCKRCKQVFKYYDVDLEKVVDLVSKEDYMVELHYRFLRGDEDIFLWSRARALSLFNFVKELASSVSSSLLMTLPYKVQGISMSSFKFWLDYLLIDYGVNLDLLSSVLDGVVIAIGYPPLQPLSQKVFICLKSYGFSVWILKGNVINSA